MSELVMTAAFGPASRHRTTPRQTRVFAELLVGGSGVYRFHGLVEPGLVVIVRADDASPGDVLMAGCVMVDPCIDVTGRAKEHLEVAMSKRQAGADLSGEVLLGRDAAALIAESVAHLPVAGLVTSLGAPDLVAQDFRGWPVAVARTDHAALEAKP